MDPVAPIRAQRREVEARLAFAHAREAEAKVLAWWRLHLARRLRLAVVTGQEARCLLPMPPPPRGALTPAQRALLALGLLRLERAAPPRPVARRLMH